MEVGTLATYRVDPNGTTTLVSAAGNTVANVVYATAIINLPFYARLVRAEVLVRREAGFVMAAAFGVLSSARTQPFAVFLEGGLRLCVSGC